MYAKFTGRQYEAYKQLMEDYRIQDYALKVIYTYHGTGDWESGPYAPLNEIERYSLVQAIVNDHYEVHLTFQEELEKLLKQYEGEYAVGGRQVLLCDSLQGELAKDIREEAEHQKEILWSNLQLLNKIYRMYLSKIEAPYPEDEDDEWEEGEDDE